MSAPQPLPVQVRSWHVLAGLAALVGVALLLRWCTGGADEQPSSGSPEVEAVAEAPVAEDEGALPRAAVTLFLPAADAPLLREVPGEIFATAAASDRAKQLVGQVLAPPSAAGVVAPFPPGTTLRALFLDRKRGTAYVSLSKEARGPATQGSAGELLAVGSLVNTLTRSLPEVKRVQLLVEGQEVESLTGHLDLTAPLAFNPRLVSAAP